MKLKKLKLLGFKSFADEVILNFDASLIALVGPNGCGKSNIVDAFRWVIGEQSAKSMRAGTMQDVIFAGSETRKGLNFAEVSVTLSEMQGIFSEVTLTRRLHKNGDSEYLINKEPARLKDLQGILFSSGLGKSAFSIFEQGKLDEIIYLNPNERRVIFDDAASISGFLQRKKESNRRLDEVSQNFSRIKDIHAEVDKRVRLLKKQAEEAQNYQKKKDRLAHLEKGVFALQIASLHEKLEKQQEQRRILEKDIAIKTEGCSLQDVDFQEIKKALSAKEKEIKELEKKVKETEISLKTLLHDEKNENAKIIDLHLREKKILKEKADLSETDLKAQIEKNKEKQTLLEKQKNEREAERKKIHNDYNLLSKSLFDLQAEEKKEAKEERSIFEERLNLDKKLQEKILFKNRFKDDLKAIANKIQEEKSKIEELQKKESEKRALLKLLLDDAAVLKKEAEEASQEFKQNLSSLQATDKACADLSLEIKKLSIQESTEGFTKGGKALLKEAQEQNSPLFGKLKPLCTSIAVSAEFVDEVMAYAKKKKITGFCLASVEKDVDDKCLLYFVGETSEENRIVQLKKVEADLKRFKVELIAEEEKKKTFASKRELLEKKKSEIEESFRKKEIAQVQENFFLQQILKDLKKCFETIEKAQAENEKLEKSALAIEDEVKKLQESLQNVEARKKQLEERQSQLQKQLIVAQQNQIEKEKQRKVADNSFQETFAEFQKIVQEIKILEAKQEWKTLQEKKWEEELLEIGLKKQKAQKVVEEAFNEKNICSNLLNATTELLKKEEEGLKEIVEKQNQMQKLSLFERKNLSVLEAKHQQLETSVAENEENKAKLESEFFQRFNEKSLPHFELSLQEAEKEAARLRYECEKEALVNMTSIEESKQEEERFSHLDRQLVDLKGAKEDLEKIIKNLDHEARKLFKESFEAIRLNFQKNFALFFNGGKADLKFVGSQDVLEAGIEIVAEPKGKQMRSISLLSGGEKCMTALALLFSIFEVKPAPFCILDEVDAPLDDANVERFTSVLHQYIASTQFIIVTHNKKTMAKADTIFGVSMEEKGVSKLISIEFEKRKVLEKVK